MNNAPKRATLPDFKPQSPATMAVVPAALTPPTAAERALIGRLSVVAPPALANGLAKALQNPSVQQIHVDNNPAAQHIVDSVFALRSAARLRRLSDVSTVGNTENVDGQVIVALVEHLSDPTASAVILRRIAKQPHDIILLQRETASAAELAGAMKTLADARVSGGETPSKNLMIVTHRRGIPAAWHAAGTDRRVEWILSSLRNGDEVNLPGVGPARAVTFTLGHSVR